MVKTILTIDDEPALRRLLDVVLGDAGFRVEAAEDGPEALEKIDASPPDLCVLDVMMPKMDGWDVLRTLRERPETHDLPVVMLTARGETRDRLRGWELGCDSYIPKPFDPPDVVQEVAAVLARSTEERRAQRDRQLEVIRAMMRDGRKIR